MADRETPLIDRLTSALADSYHIGERYDKLRRDPRGAALLAKTEVW
jgi:hypothetical protein